MSDTDKRWNRIDLSGRTETEETLLGRDGKTDGGDASRALVRAGRFTGSFMMATNGGATYETLLRPPPPAPAAEAPSTSPRPPAGGALHNVFGRDDRVVVGDTAMIPARSIGLLKIFLRGGGIRWGTAWLIGPRVLATAGHNLIHPQDGPAARLEVGLAYDGSTARGGWHHVIDNALPQAWIDAPSDRNTSDYAAIKIADPEVGNRLGWFGFADYEDAKFNNMLLNLFGYPMDGAQRFAMYGAAGRTLDVDADRIYYDCDAGGGMSGGPLIARFGEQRIAVGIHIGGGVASNAATRLTAEAYDLFKARESW